MQAVVGSCVLLVQLQQQIRHHRAQQLQFDRIGIASEKAFELQMLFEPFEQQFNLPALFVGIGNLLGCGGQVVAH